jgi:hypothetical protein
MKKILLISTLILSSLLVNAQVTLEKTYSEISANGVSFSCLMNLVNEALYSTSKVVKYFAFDSRDNTVKIYNLDHSLSNSGTIKIPTGYTCNYLATAISTKLFNSDDKVEFIATFSKTTNNITTYSQQIITEDGVVIKDLGNIQYSQVYVGSDNKYKLLCTHPYLIYTNYPTEYHYEFINDIYTIGGTVPLGVSPLRTPLDNPSPNPSNTVITLPYQLKQGEISVMRIFNINGLLIESKQIDFVFDKILLNVSEYAKGVYFYEVNGVSNRFVVN